MAEMLVEAMDVRSGWGVLDVAAGSGNASLAAGRRGCWVTSTDYVPALLERGRARAEAEGVRVAFQEADAEDLPFAEGAFRCGDVDRWGDVRAGPGACGGGDVSGVPGWRQDRAGQLNSGRLRWRDLPVQREVRTFAALNKAGQAGLTAGFMELVAGLNRAEDGTMVVPSEYLEVVITH